MRNKEPVSVSLGDEEKAIVKRLEIEDGLSLSGAIRKMIRFWDRLNPGRVITIGGEDNGHEQS